MKHIKTIIFGGAFNPPTVDHEAILQACIDYAEKVDADVWVMPSGDRHDKQISVDRSRRLEYIEAMICDSNVSDIVDINISELDRKEAVETYITVKELSKAHPNRSFIWVFGSDSVKTMPSWRNGKWLLNNLDIIAINRRGHELDSSQNHIAVLDVKMLGTSSTEVRRRLEANESINGLVGSSVKTIIYQNSTRTLAY